MFLSRRATQAEYTDDLGLPASVVSSTYRELGLVNRLLVYADPFQRLLPKWLGYERCSQLTILDLGAGDGDLGRKLERWAAAQGWRWQVTNLDFNAHALQLNGSGRNVVGSVTSLPFRDNSFDVVIASQMTHHLPADESVVRHFAEAFRVSRLGVYITDLHRNAGIYAFLWLMLRVIRLSPYMIHDGLLSIRRGWRVGEWKKLAQQAGLSEAEVSLYYGSRIILQARKPAPALA